MKAKTLILYMCAMLAATGVWGQSDKTDTVKTEDTVKIPDCPIDVYYRIGLRGGVNIANMVYTYDIAAMQRYDHIPQLHGMGSLFIHLGFEGTGLSVSPEVGVMGKGVRLKWDDPRIGDDVDYRMNVTYLDFRMPLTYNFRLKGKPALSPYLTVVPDFGAAFGGNISYAGWHYTPEGESRPETSTKITHADVNIIDYGVMFGAGIDYLIKTKNMPLVFSLEAGWNMGLKNTFAERENLNGDNLPPNASNIRNRFFGAELWRKERHSRGIEVAMRLAIPLTSYRQKKKEEEKPLDENIYKMALPRPEIAEPEPVRVLDTVRVNGFNYVKKDCYSLYEMYTFLKEGVDISDKRICMYNINFDFDSDRLRPESEGPLNEVLNLLNTFPEISIEIYGHTDSIGTEIYNQGLSERRAASAARYLIEHGIDPFRLTSIGFGKLLPIDTNETEEGRFHNRRVEFEILNAENIYRNRNKDENNDDYDDYDE